jgi:hypothetical protein
LLSEASPIPKHNNNNNRGIMRKTHIQEAYPWPTLRNAKIAAYEKLPDEIKEQLKNEQGVYDLDKVQYTLHIRWFAGTPRATGVPYSGTTSGGWYPEVVVGVPKDLLTSLEE